MKTLVVAAHPDDEVLGCGGTIARLAREGHEVYIAILGEGLTSRYAQRHDADPELIRQLHARSRKVADLLGATGVFLYSLPDNRFDTVPMLEVVKIVEGLVRQLKPAAIYTQHGGDLNVDHVTTFRATLTATRPVAQSPVKAVYGFPVGSSSEWAFQQFSPIFQPNTFVDVSSTLELKLRAMQLYESEARPFPHPRSEEALRAAAEHWGGVVGVAAAEPFQCIRQQS
jgi:LmbE family N-acetylglucosaminyl deacetylase